MVANFLNRVLNYSSSQLRAAEIFLARMGPLTSANSIPSGTTNPFCSISTSPFSLMFQRILRVAGIRLRQSEVPQALSSAAIKALGTSDGQMVFGYSREASKRSIWALRTSLWPDVASAMDSRSSECDSTVAKILYGQMDVCS